MNLKTVLITTILVFLSTNSVFAENYILMSPEAITEVECQGGVISVKPLTTLMNEKKTMIISPIKNGSTEFKVKLKNRSLSYRAVVNDGKIEFHGNKVIKIVPLDLPPEFVSSGDSCK